jgi:hypothetical protein
LNIAEVKLAVISPFPPKFSEMDTCTVPLYMYETTKGFGERKILRKLTGPSKSAASGKSSNFCPFHSPQSSGKNWMDYCIM